LNRDRVQEKRKGRKYERKSQERIHNSKKRKGKEKKTTTVVKAPSSPPHSPCPDSPNKGLASTPPISPVDKRKIIILPSLSIPMLFAFGGATEVEDDIDGVPL